MSTAPDMLSGSSMSIYGVEIKDLKTHKDQRGFFREIIRITDPFFSIDGRTSASAFGQWSHSRMERNVVKAWHYHHVQYDWWYLGIGTIEVVLFDNRPESPTYKEKLNFYLGEKSAEYPEAKDSCVKIPPGVLHGCKVVSTEAHLFYITSVTYDPNEEGRFPFDSNIVGHDWGENAIVADNDKRTFEPTSKRKPISTK